MISINNLSFLFFNQLQNLSYLILLYYQIQYLFPIHLHKLLFLLLVRFCHRKYLYRIIRWIIVLYSFQDIFIPHLKLTLFNQLICVVLLRISPLTYLIVFVDIYANRIQKLLLYLVNKLQLLWYLMVEKTRCVCCQSL